MGLCCSCCADPPPDFDAPVDISHFELGRVIGKGAFGKVRIVEHKKYKVDYALKYINKEECAKQALANNMLRERKLLEECSSPFVCNLRYAFQDDLHLMMVMDLKLGGDLEFHLQTDKTFNEGRAKFYFAEITCGLSYLHSLKIVHRDLKPGNVLLDEFGHVSITDFNIACHYDEKKPMTSRSGTLSYMAPEVIDKIPYLNSIDWWSLGIMTYEMLFGHTPFAHSYDDRTKEAIRNAPLEFPDAPQASEFARDILTGLIERDVSKRLGAAEFGGDRKIKSHKWFEGWSWEMTESREMPVPFKPDVVKNQYYNPLLELEEVLFEDNPLQSRPVKHKEVKINSNGNLLTTEEETDKAAQIRMLTEGFEDFDFTKIANLQKSPSMIIDGTSNKTSLEHLVSKSE